MPTSDQPLVLARLDALLVGLRIGQACEFDLARLVDLFLGAVADEDRLAAPEHLDDLPLGDRARDRPRPERRRRSSTRPGSSARSAAPAPRRRRRRPRCRLRCKGNRGVSARPKLLSQSQVPLLAGQPTRAENRRMRYYAKQSGGGGRAGRRRPWGRTKGGNPAAFIGTLIKRAQARTGSGNNGKKSHKSFGYVAIRH